jgi:hypothetical protein
MAIQRLTHESGELLAEIERYLATVDVFRAEGAGPTWAKDETPPGWWLDEHLSTLRL